MASINTFSPAPAVGASSTTTINASTLVAITSADSYFDNISKFARVDIYFTHEDGREEKIVSHTGTGLTGTMTLSSLARTGTWRVMRVFCRDTDGAILWLTRAQLSTDEDFTI